MNGLRFTSLLLTLLLALAVIPLGCGEQTFEEACRSIGEGDDWESVNSALLVDGGQVTCVPGSPTICRFFESDVVSCAGQPSGAKVCSCLVGFSGKVRGIGYACTVCSGQ